MMPGKTERLCLSCTKIKAAVTGLCRRCYSRLRYHETIAPTSGKFCERCNCFMEKGGIVREDTGTYQRRRFMQSYYCPKCGAETTSPP